MLARPEQQVGHVGAADRLALGVPEVEREEDVQRAERDDERRQLQPRDQRAVDQAARGADAEADAAARAAPGTPESAESLAITIDDRTMIAPTERSMPGGEDDQRLGDAQRADHHHLLDDQRQVRRLEEAVGGDAEDDDREQQDEQRAQRRRCGAGGRGRGCRASRRARRRRTPAVPAPWGAGTSLRSGFDMARLAPAVLEAERRVLGLDAVDRLVGDQRHAGVDEVLAGGRPRASCRLSAKSTTASTPISAIFSGYCCEVAPMTPRLDVLHARAAAVDGDDRDVLLLAGGLERLVRARGGGLVDRVDEVDRRRPSGAGSPSPCGRPPRRRRSRRGRRSAGRSRRRSSSRRSTSTPKPFEEALVALHVDRDAVGVEVEHGDLRLLALLLELRLGPLADQPRRPRSCRWRTSRRRRRAARSACRAR